MLRDRRRGPCPAGDSPGPPAVHAGQAGRWREAGAASCSSLPGEHSGSELDMCRIGRGPGRPAPGAAVGAHTPTSAGFALAGVAPLASNAEGIGFSPRDGGLAYVTVPPVAVKLDARAAGGMHEPTARSWVLMSGWGSPRVSCRCVEGAALPAAPACRLLMGSARQAVGSSGSATGVGSVCRASRSRRYVCHLWATSTGRIGYGESRTWARTASRTSRPWTVVKGTSSSRSCHWAMWARPSPAPVRMLRGSRRPM